MAYSINDLMKIEHYEYFALYFPFDNEPFLFDKDTITNWLKSFRTKIDKDGYMVIWKNRLKPKSVHKWIMGNNEDFIIDHINRNRRDNRKCNLRFVKRLFNARNRKAKGFYFHKTTNKYIANIKLNGISTALGSFNTPEEAEKAYKEAVKKHRPETFNLLYT